MPVITAWIPVENVENRFREPAVKLGAQLLRLVKVRAWMQLPSPPDKGKFPYRLFLKKAETGELKINGPLIEKDIYGLVIRTDKETLDAVKEKQERYVYVFSINSNGKGTLLFPDENMMDSGNHFPAGQKWPTEIRLGKEKLFEITPPFGLDTFFLLTTKEPVSNPAVLNFEGVRGDSKGILNSPLERLLYGIGSPTRRSRTATFTGWSIQRLPILSIPGKK